MDNKTLISMYNVINENIELAKTDESITDIESKKTRKMGTY